MNRHGWYLLTMLLCACALCGTSSAGDDPPLPPSGAAGLPKSVPPIVKAVFEEDRKDIEKARGEVAPVPAVPAVASALPKQGLVPELVAILNETKSLDTFLVTLRLLEGMGKQAEPAIPAIIRNAERLEVFKDHSAHKEGNSERIDAIVKSLERIRGKETAEPYRGDKKST